MSNFIYKVGIIGAGVSGCVNALQLAEQGIETILFEQKQTVVNGPPFCHLHAGGNLYPDISDEQCRQLMKQSIEMARLFPQSIDKRPTLISIPKTAKYEFTEVHQRLQMLVDYYQQLIDFDPANQVLGSPTNYYQIYTQADLQRLKNQASVATPNTPDEWMVNAIQYIDDSKLKMPIILVQEYGWNLFRLGAQAQLALEQARYCDLRLNTSVQTVKDVRDDDCEHNWEIQTNTDSFKVTYLINASGYKTGLIDDSLALQSERHIEFKAAYLAKWQPTNNANENKLKINALLPEMIFHGERGTPTGMAQLTPYCDDYYQIHGMTKDITLFDNGLVKSTTATAQPKFNSDITDKLDYGWSIDETKVRTKKSITHIANFIPDFKTAVVGGLPLFGAQQIPGDDPDLRVGEVCFSTPFYARSEIVKASSALTVAQQIIEQLQQSHIISAIPTEHSKPQPNQAKISLKNKLLQAISTDDIDTMAAEFTKIRGYPTALSRLLIPQK